MRLILILAIASIFQNLSIFGQTRTVSGKVINEDLEPISEVRIQNSDSLLLARTDINGKFEIDIPTNARILFFGWVGYEWKSINLSANCDTLEVILMYLVTYDFISLKKVDKLRMKRFKKLSELYSEAYKKGIFYTQQPCYDQKFSPFEKK